MAHILFITPYYPPEITAPAFRISDTAARLVKLGHKVTVLTTFPNFPTGVVPLEYRGQVIQREIRDEVSIVRVWSFVCPNRGFLRRLLAQFSFACLSPILGWKAIGRPDAIIVESPPLFDAIAGRMLAWFKHCPFIFTVADLWPESAIQLGMLRNRILIRLAEWLEWSTYRRASMVWALTEGICDVLIKSGLPSEKILLVTNGVDTTKFRPLSKTEARTELDWDDRFTILYPGNHGLVYAMTTILEAADLLRNLVDIHFVLVGDGVKKQELIMQAKRRDLKNVTFLDSVPHDRMPLLLAGADVCLVPLRKVPLLKGTLPFKMFEIMACERPFVLGAEGIAHRLVEREAVAISVEPEESFGNGIGNPLPS